MILPKTTPKMKKVEAYRCGHCGRLFMRSFNCKRHEEQLCTKNPKIRPLCFDCKLFHNALDEKEGITIYFDSPFGEDHSEYDVSPHRCKHPQKGCKLFFDYHMHEEVRVELIEDGWEAMPTKGNCEYFQPWTPEQPFKPFK